MVGTSSMIYPVKLLQRALRYLVSTALMICWMMVHSISRVSKCIFLKDDMYLLRLQSGRLFRLDLRQGRPGLVFK